MPEGRFNLCPCQFVWVLGRFNVGPDRHENLLPDTAAVEAIRGFGKLVGTRLQRLDVLPDSADGGKRLVNNFAARFFVRQSELLNMVGA